VIQPLYFVGHELRQKNLLIIANFRIKRPTVFSSLTDMTINHTAYDSFMIMESRVNEVTWSCV